MPVVRAPQRRWGRRWVAGCVVAVLAATPGVTGCAAEVRTHDGDADAAVIASAVHPAQGSPSARRPRTVVIVSVDGLRSSVIGEVGHRGAPTLHRLLRGGIGTLNARTTVEETRTLPDHASMMTGRRVRVRHDGHGVNVNSDPGGTVHDRAGERVASIFSVVARHGGRPALFTAKEKFDLFRRSWPRALSRFVLRSDDRGVARAVARDLRRHRRALTFVHYAAPDLTGHEHGFGSSRYRRAIEATDRRLGHLLRVIRSSPGLRERTTLLLTSDHGGTGHGHEEPRVAEHYRVPFLAWGRGVAAGRDLYRLNPERRRPGGSQPDYAGRQPIRNADVANLALDLLGLGAVPGSQLNRPNTLDLRPD